MYDLSPEVLELLEVFLDLDLDDSCLWLLAFVFFDLLGCDFRLFCVFVLLLCLHLLFILVGLLCFELNFLALLFRIASSSLDDSF